ncbi:MAG: DUF2202 domain-containing protein [Myxococcota bacterium]
MRKQAWAVLAVVSAWSLGCGPASPSEESSTSSEPLTAAESSSLTFLREEEKLARDVYLALGARYGQVIFTNIAASEQQHMDAVLTLLDRYGLADPAAGRAEGEFADAQLQALYDQLVVQGEAGLTAALGVGAAIEDLDLADLARFTAQTTRPDVLTVYANLSKGSRNHLRSFTGQLTSLGVTYTPQHLDAATYEAIVSSPMERGPAR